MIVYNVTVKIGHDVHADWLNWMKTIHIPEVMKTGLFEEHKFLKLFETEHAEDEQGVSYAIQYWCTDKTKLKTYQEVYAPKLQKKHLDRYRNKFVAFRTLLETVE